MSNPDTEPTGRTLTFEGIPERDVAAYSLGVLDALMEMASDWDYDEVSPPNEDGECTLIVAGVLK